MEFDSIDEVYFQYKVFVFRSGFGVTKMGRKFTHEGDLKTVIFACSKEEKYRKRNSESNKCISSRRKVSLSCISSRFRQQQVLQTQAKVNYAPYGIDFSGPTGRFTNGRTFADIIAQLLGLPFAPPYMGLSAEQRSTITTGINYASGILNETGTALGRCISLKEQIDQFEETHGHLSADHLSKAIFLVSIGSNDYLNNYLSPLYGSSKIYTPHQFADHLLSAYNAQLTRLYVLGGRKFVVTEIGALGCMPVIVNILKPIDLCSDLVNGLVSLFNVKLPSLLNQLQYSNPGSVFVHNKSAKEFQTGLGFLWPGFRTASMPCCEVTAPGSLCLANTQPCGDRRLNVFWDSIHPTEAVFYPMAVSCFNSTGQCTPVNVQQLTSA
ncbi:GDSL esterase/lipase [Acorus calamus]|uniref:GDSL esterase/lipase n=1 Tax=Acorus calamus TaxID=4465 RepID=A0AAV9ESF7_ACOCL|nr:GDSL esterase/lipase [Acorus calamus]